MSSGRITTHALDLLRGRPAEGLKVELWRITGDGGRLQLSTAVLNGDGRADSPLLSGGGMERGEYELQFAVGDYFAKANAEDQAACGSAVPTLFDTILIRFRVADETQHYHVPLLAAPGGYSTYRGS